MNFWKNRKVFANLRGEKMLDIYFEKFEEKPFSNCSYKATIMFENKNEVSVLYKVRVSSLLKQHVTVKPNMGLVLPQSKVKVDLTFLYNQEVKVQVASALIPDDETLERSGISLANFNDAWAITPHEAVTKQVLLFDRGDSGPTAHFIPSYQEMNPEFQKANMEPMSTIQAAKERGGDEILQTAMDTISELQQIRSQQEDVIEKLNGRIRLIENGLDFDDSKEEIAYNKDNQRSISWFELLALASFAFVLANVLTFAVNSVMNYF